MMQYMYGTPSSAWRPIFVDMDISGLPKNRLALWGLAIQRGSDKEF